MKLILIVALLGLYHVNGLPTEETLKSIEGDSDFDLGGFLRSRERYTGYVWVKNKSSRVDHAFTRRLEHIGRDGINKYGSDNVNMMGKHFRYHMEIDYPGKWSCMAAKTMAFTIREVNIYFRVEVDDIEVTCLQYD